MFIYTIHFRICRCYTYSFSTHKTASLCREGEREREVLVVGGGGRGVRRMRPRAFSMLSPSLYIILLTHCIFCFYEGYSCIYSAQASKKWFICLPQLCDKLALPVLPRSLTLITVVCCFHFWSVAIVFKWLIVFGKTAFWTVIHKTQVP